LQGKKSGDKGVELIEQSSLVTIREIGMGKRYLLLLVIGAACVPLPAVADSPISFFGKLDADVESVGTSQPGAGVASSRNRIATNASRLGVRGSKDMGDGLQAIWQIASRVNLNGAETGGGGGTFTLWGNSNVGIQGNFGTVFLGVWDTPFRQAYNKVDQFDNSHIASPIAVLGSIGNGVGGATTISAAALGVNAAVANVTVASTGFHRRQKSSLQYWSPLYQQVQLKLAYSVDDPANKTSAVNPALWSLSAAYDSEPLYLAVAYELHQDFKVLAGSIVSGKDTGTRLIGAYHLGASNFGLVYERLSFSTPASGDTARTALSLSGSYRFGDSNLGLVYTHAGDLSGTTNTGADQLSLRYGYIFAKDAELYGQYTSIHNRANGTYNFGDGLNITTASGARISGFGVGMAYAF
jgi:predicted porin